MQTGKQFGMTTLEDELVKPVDGHIGADAGRQPPGRRPAPLGGRAATAKASTHDGARGAARRRRGRFDWALGRRTDGNARPAGLVGGRPSGLRSAALGR